MAYRPGIALLNRVRHETPEAGTSTRMAAEGGGTRGAGLSYRAPWISGLPRYLPAQDLRQRVNQISVPAYEDDPSDRAVADDGRSRGDALLSQPGGLLDRCGGRHRVL